MRYLLDTNICIYLRNAARPRFCPGLKRYVMAMW